MESIQTAVLKRGVFKLCAVQMEKDCFAMPDNAAQTNNIVLTF